MRFLSGEVWSSPTVHAISMHHGQDLNVFAKSSGAQLQQELASLQLLETACLITSSSPGLRRLNLVASVCHRIPRSS